MNFNSIWPRFKWVIDELKEGMCFFEGYIPTISEDELLSPLSNLISRARNHSFKSSVWSNDTSESDWEKEYSHSQYVESFYSNKIHMLHFDYELETDAIVLSHRLIFERDDVNTALEIICYRGPILESIDPKESVKTAICEFQFLKNLFKGNALFIGPDTLDYPSSSTEYPDLWIKIE